MRLWKLGSKGAEAGAGLACPTTCTRGAQGARGRGEEVFKKHPVPRVWKEGMLLLVPGCVFAPDEVANVDLEPQLCL